ncbi:hypothetical protein TruAng_006936 [Truncatella angustata]|nr:hypothetical protein TruAng_006936 [Truncatella angustata]
MYNKYPLKPRAPCGADSFVSKLQAISSVSQSPASSFGLSFIGSTSIKSACPSSQPLPNTSIQPQPSAPSVTTQSYDGGSSNNNNPHPSRLFIINYNTTPPPRNIPTQYRQDVHGKIGIWYALLHMYIQAPFQLTWQTDRGINTFSPEGRLFQVEYSLEAIKLGSTAIGVATSEGVVLGVEKRVTSTLLETSSVEKIVEIDRHIGCAMSGLQADARSMVEHARVESQSHTFNFNEPLRVESCTQAICDLALRFGESAEGEESIMSRPFGVALLIAGYDEDGPSLYHAEPSGTFYRYDAKAIGSGSEGAQAELQNEYHKSLTIVDAETLVLKTLKQVMEEKLDAKNVQLASVTKEKGFRIYTDEEMAAVVERLPAN